MLPLAVPPCEQLLKLDRAERESCRSSLPHHSGQLRKSKRPISQMPKPVSSLTPTKSVNRAVSASARPHPHSRLSPPIAGRRELRLKARLPAPLNSLSAPQRTISHRKITDQKQSPRVTTLLAQRIHLSGNSYFWRTGSQRFQTLRKLTEAHPPDPHERSTGV